MIKRLNHVSVAVASIEDALRFYRDMLGLEVTRIETLDDRQLRVAFVRVGDTEIELLEPTSSDNTVTRFLERRGPGLHHLCLEVDDIDAAMDELRARGAEFVDPEPSRGAVGRVAFMLPDTGRGVLVELNEPAREARSD
jgi:lactoylglutathione lyase/methylmalonyl-CoA/ethylmalonyl-CoA epimerase